MKLRYIISAIPTAMIIAVTTSCVKDELFYTPHPDEGAVVVTADFSNRSADSQLPDSYTLRIGTHEQTVSGTTNTFDQLLSPGDYTLLIYNDPAGITISGTTATVESVTDSTINSSLGSLFSGTQQISVAADDTLYVSQVMRQLTRTLVLRLNISAEDAQRIVSIRSTLTGIASRADIATATIDESVWGTIGPGFELKSEAVADSAQWYIEASEVILGIVKSTRQILTIIITLDTGQEIIIEDDISDDIDDINGGGGGGGGGGDDDDDDNDPFEIDSDLQLPVEPGASGTIGPWNKGNDDDGPVSAE